jgi:hypothetical protein
VEQLGKERDAQSKFAQEQKVQIEQLSKEHDVQAELAKENQAQKDEALQKLAEIRQDSEEVMGRQHLVSEGITRAEAQIDLIKDLLLRETGL